MFVVLKAKLGVRLAPQMKYHVEEVREAADRNNDVTDEQTIEDIVLVIYAVIPLPAFVDEEARNAQFKQMEGAEDDDCKLNTL